MEKEEYVILNDLISKDFQLEGDDTLINGYDIPDINKFHNNLILLIDYLIENDMHRLLNVMYRLDVSEAKFHDTMQSLSKEEAAIQLANLIIEREMQKVKTRLHYKKHRKF